VEPVQDGRHPLPLALVPPEAEDLPGGAATVMMRSPSKAEDAALHGKQGVPTTASHTGFMSVASAVWNRPAFCSAPISSRPSLPWNRFGEAPKSRSMCTQVAELAG
jgi:hypothetical protein